MTPEHTLNVTALIDRSRISRMQYAIFFLGALAFGLDGLDTQIIGYIAPSLLAAFHAPRAVLGELFSSGLVGLLIGSLAIGPFADKFGRKRVIILSVVSFGVFTLISAYSSTIGELVMWRFITGLGLGAAIPNIMALVSDYCPAQRRATVIMLVAAANAAGATLGALLAGQLLPLWGWRAMFYFGGIAPLVLAVFLCFYLQESLSWLIVRKRAPELVKHLAAQIGGSLSGVRLIAEGEQGVDYKTFLTRYMREPRNIVNTLAIMIIYFMVMFEMFFMSSWITTVLVENGFPIRSAIHSSSLFQTGGFVGMILIAFFAAGKDITRLFTAMLMAACAAIVATSFTLHGSPPVISAMLFITGFLLVPCLPGGSSIVGRTYPVAIRATAFGAAYAAGRLGSVFGPFFGQKLHELGLSSETIFLASALPCLIAALAVLVVHHNTTRDPSGMLPVVK